MRELCSWDHEVLTNHVGANKFEHRESKTEKILKPSPRSARTELKKSSSPPTPSRQPTELRKSRVRGGDGKWHQVPVKWVEYTPVERSTYILVSALADRRITSDTKPRQQREMEWGKHSNTLTSRNRNQ